MTTIRSIIADGDGVKGRRFTLDCTQPTLVIGPNGSGKSARLAAPFLALGTHIGGSSVPGALGDVPADCGRVELMVEGETSDGRPLSLTRVFGAKHEARLQVGDEPLVKDAKGVEAQLVAHFGAQRCQPTDLGDFVALTAEKQAAMVAKVAGVTLADPAIRADLDARLGATSVEYDDARGMPRKGAPDEKQLATVRAALDGVDAEGHPVPGGLDAAKEAARVQKNVWQKKKDAAVDTRGTLVDLRRDDLPPGSLADAQGREHAAREDLSRVREKLASRDQAVRERQRAAARVEQARGRLASLPPAPAAAASDPAADLAELGARYDEARGAREAANDAHAVTDRALHDAHSKIRTLDDQLAAIAEGCCPTCGTTGEVLDAARQTIARRRAVAAARFAAAERADITATAAVDAARAVEAAAQEALRAAQFKADRQHERALLSSRAAADRTGAEAELAAAETALAALPPVEALGDLEGTRERLEGELSQAADAVAQLAGFEEAERLRAQNEADLDSAILARATWGALERTLGAYGVELARRAADRVCNHADQIVGPVYDDGSHGFGFRPLPASDGDEPTGWGFGLETTDPDGGGCRWRPYSALSDSEQIVCGVALTYAMQQLGARPFRPVVLDRLEALETPRALRLLRTLAEEQRAGRLSLVLCAMRTDGPDVPAELLSGLDHSGIALVRALDDDPRARPLVFPVKGEAAPAVAANEGEKPEAAVADSGTGRLRGNAKIMCTGRATPTPTTVSAHRATGCTCGAEERELARRGGAIRGALGSPATAGGEGEAA